MGPSAVRYAGLASALQELGYETKDSGDIHVLRHYSLSDTSFNLRAEAIAEACTILYNSGKQAVQNGEIPIFLGGDHSASIGTIGGVTHNTECGIIWVDAHGDFNTPETSTSCNVHGMGLATLLGQGAPQLVNIGRIGAKVASKNVVLIGVRDLDSEEKILLKKSGCTIYTMRDIDELGVRTILEQTLEKFASLSRIHLSFDMDVMEIKQAPGVGTLVPGGLTYREGQLLMETIADSEKLNSLDIMEINPILDIKNKTAETAVSLIASLFGKTIL